MAARLQLGQMIEGVRHEIGQSINASQGINQRERIKYILGRVQDELLADPRGWPHLEIFREADIVAHVSSVAVPDEFGTYEAIRHISTPIGGDYVPIVFGINDSHYNAYGPSQTASPIQRWDTHPSGDELITVWPTPPENTTLRIWGYKKVKPLLNEDDKSELDGTLLVLYTAAELLAHMKSEDALIKLQKANDHLRRLRSRTNKTPMAVMGGGNASPRPRPWLDYIPSGGR